MKTYQLKWTLKSALSTEPESDTIFGHFCWTYLYLKGEKALTDFLHSIKIKEKAMEMSHAFLDQNIPVPKLPLSLDQIKQIEKGTDFIYERDRKGFKKLKNFSIDHYHTYRHNFSLIDLYRDHYSHKTDLERYNQSQAQKHTITHNTINRISGTTGNDGSLYQEISHYYPEKSVFYSWIKTDCFELVELQEIFNQIALAGFGKNKHTGKGHFSIEIEDANPSLFNLPDANAWLLLSNCVPSANDSTQVFYNSKVKFPKLGGFKALTDSPFKYPVFMFTPGTVFIGKQAPTGSILENIHPFQPEVVQNLCAFTLPLRLNEVNDEH